MRFLLSRCGPSPLLVYLDNPKGEESLHFGKPKRRILDIENTPLSV
jgi:hypothetical protein